MKTRFAKVLVLLTLVAAMVAMMALPASAAGETVTVTGVSGVNVSVDSKGTATEASGTVTVSTVGGSFMSAVTATVTVTNNSGSTATISFDYSASNVSDCSLGTVSNNKCSGTKFALLTAGSTTTFTITSRTWTTSTTAKIALSNFKVEAAAAESDVTVTYGSLGSVQIDGTTVASGSVNSVSSATGASFVAVPGSGSKFVAWINPANNAVLSTSATYQLVPTEAMTIRAVFASASAAPVFYADGTAKLFEGLDAAISYASSASNKVITLASDGTLPAGNYTIPAGVTLNIPYNAAGTLCTTEPAEEDKDVYNTPSVYRTLTMASGANITVNGALSLSAKQAHKYQYNGMPSGPLPFIKMASGSNITVESGGFLYAWGYITGSGSVEVKNGGTVYECFQIADYRGGNATINITSEDQNGVFPFNQYYLQNIEVPMTLHAGAKENGYTSVIFSAIITSVVEGSDVPFIGSDGSMFIIDSGYLVKDYVEGTGRTEIKIYGSVSVSEVSMSMTVGLGQEAKIDSSKYALPIPNHFTVCVESGTIDLAQKVSFLPGCEMYIKEGASCVLGSEKEIVVYDLDDWVYNNGANGYSGTANQPYVKTRYVPGGDGTVGRLKDAMVQIDGYVDASAGKVYVTSGGANIFSTGTGVVNLRSAEDTVAYQVTTNGNSISGWPQIPLQNALLKNADGSYVKAVTTDTYTYNAETGRWDAPSHTYSATEVKSTCNEAGYIGTKCEAEGCGHIIITEEIPALGHTEVIDKAVDATCTATGLTEGKHCSVCNEVLVAQKTVAALGHTETVTPAVAPTCTKSGLSEGTHCSVCGEIIVAQAIVEALDHEGVTDAAVEATCTTAGKTEGMHCERCGEVLIAQKEIPALGHTEVIDEGKAATCNEAGLTEGKHCETCGETLVAQSVISALGHDEVIDEGKDATCTETGLTEGKHCVRCGEVIIAQDEISALGHTEVIDEAVEATCTATGLTEGKHCSVCDEVLTAQEVVSAKGHSYGEWEITKNATYTEAGSKKQTCSACGDVVTEEIPVLANPVTGWNITLKDNIGVNFVMNLAETDVVTVTVNGNPVEFARENGKFSINVAAAQMMDEIAISVNDLPLAKTYSVRGYADKILNGDYDEAAQTLVKNMLVYGGAAQTYFGYNSENEKDLASYGIEVETVVPAGDGEVAVTDSLSAISFYGATLVHETKTAVRIYFTGSIGGLTFKANGNKVDATAKDDMYYVEVSGINPQDLDNDVTVVVTDGTNELTVAYSPLDYIVRMYNKAGTSAALVQALYGYYLAAAAYTA